MDTRTTPSGTADFAEVLRKLDAVLTGQHELTRLVHSRLAVPVQTIPLKEAARRLCRSTDTLKRLVARGTFTDGRPPDNRRPGADLVFFADEIEVYRSEGRKGVERLREELGRN